MAEKTQGPARSLFSMREINLLQLIQQSLIPEGLIPAVDIPTQIAWMFADAKTAVRAGIRLLVWAIEFSPIFSRRSRFSRLSAPDRATWLATLLSSSKPGVRGLAAVAKVLVYSTTYANPDVLERLAKPSAPRTESERS